MLANMPRYLLYSWKAFCKKKNLNISKIEEKVPETVHNSLGIYKYTKVEKETK